MSQKNQKPVAAKTVQTKPAVVQAKPKKVPDFQIKPMETEVEIPGIGKVKLTLQSITFGSKTATFTTTKQAMIWYKAERKAERESKSNKATKMTEKMNKQIGAMFLKLDGMKIKLGKFGPSFDAAKTALCDIQREFITEREEKEAADEAKKAADEAKKSA